MDLNNIRQQHNQAMSLIDAGMKAKKVGNYLLWSKLYHDAFLLEKSCAEALPPFPEHEPTRSALYRSAANIAYQIKNDSDAKAMAEKGLEGVLLYPVIVEELKEIIELTTTKNVNMIIEKINHWSNDQLKNAVHEIYETPTNKYANCVDVLAKEYALNRDVSHNSCCDYVQRQILAIAARRFARYVSLQKRLNDAQSGYIDAFAIKHGLEFSD